MSSSAGRTFGRPSATTLLRARRTVAAAAWTSARSSGLRVSRPAFTLPISCRSLLISSSEGSACRLAHSSASMAAARRSRLRSAAPPRPIGKPHVRLGDHTPGDADRTEPVGEIFGLAYPAMRARCHHLEQVPLVAQELLREKAAGLIHTGELAHDAGNDRAPCTKPDPPRSPAPASARPRPDAHPSRRRLGSLPPGRAAPASSDGPHGHPLIRPDNLLHMLPSHADYLEMLRTRICRRSTIRRAASRRA